MVTEHDLRIRLIHLHPRRSEPEYPRLDKRSKKLHNNSEDALDLVSCTLFSTSLASAPPYKALSYTWGDQTLTTQILLNGNRIDVTINLEEALRHISETISEPLTIWIDSICINQQDEQEKSSQVARMRDVYSQAEEVISWLGSSSEHNKERNHLAIRWISEFGGRAQALKIGSTPDLLLKKVLERAEKKDLARELNSDTNPDYDQLIAALQDLLERPYWSRIWIVQEVAMAASINFVSTYGKVDIGTLHHSLRLLRNFRQWQLVKYGYDVTGLSLDSTLKRTILQTNPSLPIQLLKVSRSSDMPMISLLHHLQRFQASDPRDRIFALLGLAKDAESLNLRPDYSKACEQVYTEVSRTLLRRGHFEVLAHCIHEPHKTGSRLKLQSWVRDWAVRTTCSPLQQRTRDRSGNSILQPEFRASGELAQAECEAVEIECWTEPLRLSVITIGRVVCVGPAWKRNDLGHWLQALQNLSQLPSCRQPHIGERMSAVWRTAVADQEVRNHREKPRLWRNRGTT